MNRRDWLKTAGGLVVGFTFGGVPAFGGQAVPAGPPGNDGRPLDPKEVDSFLSIHPDGSVTVYTSKVDVGTGMRIAMAQMAAEELGVDTARITVVDGDTARCPNIGGTGGSTGLTRGGTAVRQAAATARQALLGLAATRLKRPVADLTIVAGEVRPAAGGRGVPIGDLIGGRRLALPVDAKAPLVLPSQYVKVGQSPPRPEVHAKCTGRYQYIQDFSVPGMLHGRVIRPPAVGATLVSVDEASVAQLPGVRVVRVESFLAVVSDDEWAAVRASRELKAKWTAWRGLPGHDNLERYLREGVVERDQAIVNRGPSGPISDGDQSGAALEAALASAKTTMAATYFWPCQSHASLAPSCAVADVRGDAATIWTSSQATYGMRATLSRVFGLVPEKVRVVFVEGSGIVWHERRRPRGGRRRAPVEDDWQAGARPMVASGRAWMGSERPAAAARPEGGPRCRRPDRGVGHADVDSRQPPRRADPPRRRSRRAFPRTAGATPPPSSRTAIRRTPSITSGCSRTGCGIRPLNPSNLRAPGKPANVFAVESFTDEIAAKLRADALEFRTARLTDPRAFEVLTRAAAAFRWQRRPSPNDAGPVEGALLGRGVAYTRYKQAENYIATFIEVAVYPESGRIAVRRVVCAHDCGLVVNPEALRNQIEGGIVQTLSRALHEEVQFDESRVTSVDWSTYPILTFPEAPAVEVILIERRDQPLWGAGEASTVPVAAALGNAVFDATGVRLRRVPFTAARVKAALAAGR